MNRAQRRALEKKNRPKKTPVYKGMTREERMDALVKNGITIDNLEKEWNKGFDAGFNQAAPSIVKTIYAAIALSANELYGFGHKRIKALLQAVDGHVMETLTSTEIIDAVWEKIGLKLDFEDPGGAIKEVDE